MNYRSLGLMHYRWFLTVACDQYKCVSLVGEGGERVSEILHPHSSVGTATDRVCPTLSRISAVADRCEAETMIKTA